MKKKTITILIIVLIVLSTLGIAGYILTRTRIQKNYHKFVKTSKTSYLYDSNHKKVGTISKGITFSLEKLTKNNKFYQIKNSPYYLLYKDVKKSVEEKESKNKNYLPLPKKLKTKKSVTLYKNGKKAITLTNGLTSPIDYIKDNNYYLTFLNSTYTIKKTKEIKEISNKTIKTSDIEVLNYENVSSSCEIENCIPIKNFKLHLEELLKNNYYTITTEEYNAYLEKNLNLKEKALLITANQTNEINTLEKELNIIIEEKIASPNAHNIKRYTSTETILKIASGEKLEEQSQVSLLNQQIPVLNYHFFYDPAQNESCNESICLTTTKFREHLDYLKNNGYKALTIEEFRSWMYNELDLPEKSVLITIDDGAMGTGKHNGNKLIPLLEEYKMPATLFLITGWWNLENYLSPYLDVQSHTFDMHQYGACGRGQVNCEPFDKVKADLQKSVDILGRTESFCFPFYYSSEQSIRAVKETGFKLAFIGGNKKATRNSNKYQIPRYPIQGNITLQEFINILS